MSLQSASTTKIVIPISINLLNAKCPSWTYYNTRLIYNTTTITFGYLHKVRTLTEFYY